MALLSWHSLFKVSTNLRINQSYWQFQHINWTLGTVMNWDNLRVARTQLHWQRPNLIVFKLSKTVLEYSLVNQSFHSTRSLEHKTWSSIVCHSIIIWIFITQGEFKIVDQLAVLIFSTFQIWPLVLWWAGIPWEWPDPKTDKSQIWLFRLSIDYINQFWQSTSKLESRTWGVLRILRDYLVVGLILIWLQPNAMSYHSQYICEWAEIWWENKVPLESWFLGWTWGGPSCKTSSGTYNWASCGHFILFPLSPAPK